MLWFSAAVVIVLVITRCFLGLLALLCQLLKAAAEKILRRRNASQLSDHQRSTVRRRRLLRRRRRQQLQPARRQRRRQLQPAILRRRRSHGHRAPRRAVLEEGDPDLAEMVVARRSNAHGQLQEIMEPGQENQQAAEHTPPTPSAELVIGRFAWRFPEPRSRIQGDPNPSELV